MLESLNKATDLPAILLKKDSNTVVVLKSSFFHRTPPVTGFDSVLASFPSFNIKAVKDTEHNLSISQEYLLTL